MIYRFGTNYKLKANRLSMSLRTNGFFMERYGGTHHLTICTCGHLCEKLYYKCCKCGVQIPCGVCVKK